MLPKILTRIFKIFSFYFFLVRKKFFPALGGYFFSFCGRVAWHACHLENQKSKVEREKNLIIYNIYKINICFTVAMTRISKIAMTRVPRHVCHATPRHVTTCAHDINRKKITPCFFTYFLITKAPKQKLIEKVTLFFGFLWLFQKK